MKGNKRIIYLAGIIAFFLLAFFSLFAGTKGLSFKNGLNVFFKILSGDEIAASAKIILLKIRLPRTIGAIFCGAALSVAGLILQTSLNNTLASPGIIGVNAGAGLLVLITSLFFPFSTSIRTIGAFAGALFSVLTVYFISEKAGISKTTLILAGVAVSSLMNAGIDVVITLHPEIVADKVSFNLGGLQNLNPSSMYFALPLILLSFVLLYLLAGGIDLFSLGDDLAYGLGLNVRAYRLGAIILSGLLAASAVSVCGLLGFVGLIIPNFIRLLGKNKCRTNISLCLLFGADFLMLCDLISRLLFYPYELPVGLFLSCLGSPFFIWMLISRRKKLSL